VTRRLWALTALLLSAVTVAATLVPASTLPRTALLGYDKVLHVGAFLLLAYAWRRTLTTPGGTLLVLGLLVAITEGGQALLHTGRTADPLDVLADVAGAGLGLLLARALARPAPLGAD
jgi:VanZ family protein